MNDRPVTVANYDNQVKAAIARGLLEAEEIPAFLADETMSRIDLGVAVGGVKVQVRQEDADRARAVLEAAATADPGFVQLTEESGAPPESEPDEPPVTDRVASRAMRGAILGLLVPPLTLYSIWLLTRLARAGESLSRLARRHAVTAIICNLLVIVYMTCFVWALYSWRHPTPRTERLLRTIAEFQSELQSETDSEGLVEGAADSETEAEGAAETEAEADAEAADEGAPSTEQEGEKSPER